MTDDAPSFQLAPAAHQRAWSWLIVALLVAVLLLAVPVVYREAHRDHIFPGVSIGPVSVGGLSLNDADQQLRSAGLVAAAAIGLSAAEKSWQLAPDSTGLTFDDRATLDAAFAVGRDDNALTATADMLRARLVGWPIAPKVAIAPARLKQVISTLATEFDQPAVDAGIRIDGATVEAVPATPGRVLNQAAALRALTAVAESGKWPIPETVLPFDSAAPDVPDATSVVDAARQLLSAPTTFRAGDKTWQLPPETLAPMLTTVKEGAAIRLALQPEPFRDWFRPVTQAISRTAESPRFHFDDATKALQRVKDGQPGQRVDTEATAKAVVNAAATGHVVDVVSQIVPALVSDHITAPELGISELVHSETSRYAGSPPERMKNIAVAASKFDGILIPPEAVFSFNQYLGDVSLAEGFVKGKIIQDGATADGVGGGVCQVSTTLFRAAFWTGMPIVERHAHGYRVGYYEQGNKPGLDATIYSPTTDLRFRNDTGHWLLIETASSAKQATVTFRLYGTKVADRTVHIEGPFESGRTPPPPARVVVDASLAPGARVNAEASRWGSTFRVVRIVDHNGEEARETFMSGYRPTGSLTQVGPEAPAAVVAEVPGAAPNVTP